MCLACVSGRERDFETRSPVESWKYVAVSSMISGGGISCSVCGIRSCERPLRELDVDRLAGELRPGDHAHQRALELADGLVELGRDELDHLGDDRGDVLALGLQLEDRDARLEVGRLDVDAQTPPEPAHQPLLEPRELVRRPVRRDHDLTAGAVEMVERVEELGLRLFAFGEELDVVDEQDVDLAVLVAERVALSFADGLDELRHELLGGHVLDPRVGHQIARCDARSRPGGASCRGPCPRR